MASMSKTISRRVIFQGKEEDVPEDLMQMVEGMIKGTGERVDEAIERLYIERCEGKILERQKHRPNTLDYFINS